MKNIFVMTLFMLGTLASGAAQQSSSTPEGAGGQTTSPSSQTSGTSRSQPSMPSSSDQKTGPSGTQAESQDPMANAPITQGCLGGNDPNYTIRDRAGTTYKLNIPPNANTSRLAQHLGEPVQVAGNVKTAGSVDNASIDVQGIGPGTGKCPASGAPSLPKQ